MSSKVSDLKQSFSFKSLRLLEWKDSQNSNVRSFSDSETTKTSTYSIRAEIEDSKSKSETNLTVLTAKDYQKRDFFKASGISKRTNSYKELENINTDFHTNLTQCTSGEIRTQMSSGVPSTEVFNHQNHSEVFTEKDMSVTITENHKVTENAPNNGLETSSPYPVLEEASKTELILGEPRCLALKKNDINPFLTDDPLIFEPDFEDDNRSFCKTPALPKNTEQQVEKFVDDMFVDEDEISASKRIGSLIDKEDGELTPEAPHKSSDMNKVREPNSSEKEAAANFFNKINECLRELNDKCREFYSSSTPDYSLAHLQRTLGNVDNIKRKLAFLVKSKNTDNVEKEKAKKSTDRSHSNMRLHSERFPKSNSSSNDNKRKQDKEEHSSGLRHDVEELYRQLKESRERRNSESVSRHERRRQRSGRSRPSQADLLNRKKTSILEKLGTKQEIERVQSLFKRQMNLITQHVIQKNEPDKKHTSRRREMSLPRRRRRRYSSRSEEEEVTEKSHDKASLDNLKTLEDMEAFLESLKKDKMLCEQYMNDQKSKGMLKFSSKKEKRSLPEASSDIPPKAPIQTSKNFKEVSRKPSGEETLKESVPKSNKNREEILIKEVMDEKVDENKFKKPKDTISYTDTFSYQESGDSHVKLPARNSNKESRLKTELNMDNKRIEHKATINETVKYKNARPDMDTKVQNSNFTKSEIELKEKEELQLNPSQNLNISTKNKDDSKREREDLSDSNHSETENENEENSRKKQKVTKYLAARRVTDKDHFKTNDGNINVGTAESLVKDLLSRKVVILDDNGMAMNNEFCIKVINNEVFLKKVSNKRKRKRSERALRPHQSKNIKRNKKNENIHKENPSVDELEFDSKRIEQGYDPKQGDPEFNQKRSEPKSDQKQIKPKLDEKQIDHQLDQRQIESSYDQKRLNEEAIEPEIDPETIDRTLNEMENFLNDLRSKKKVQEDENRRPIENTSQNREMKFLARIQAKRKAKLMACVSEGIYSTEKEAKFLKAFEKRDEDVSESSDVEARKQALLEKIRAEKDAIAEKTKAKLHDDDPLKDVKAFLDMIKEAESSNSENAKQVYVSFSLKRSDVKKLENLTTGKASLLTEESQKFLNSVRAQMKAKKTHPTDISALMKKPKD